jgi:hypothetical protein
VRSNKKKIRVGENGGLNQSKHQNSTIQVTRFFFYLIARYFHREETEVNVALGSNRNHHILIVLSSKPKEKRFSVCASVNSILFRWR